MPLPDDRTIVLEALKRVIIEQGNQAASPQLKEKAPSEPRTALLAQGHYPFSPPHTQSGSTYGPGLKDSSVGKKPAEGDSVS